MQKCAKHYNLYCSVFKEIEHIKKDYIGYSYQALVHRLQIINMLDYKIDYAYCFNNTVHTKPTIEDIQQLLAGSNKIPLTVEEMPRNIEYLFVLITYVLSKTYGTSHDATLLLQYMCFLSIDVKCFKRGSFQYIIFWSNNYDIHTILQLFETNHCFF